MQIVRTIVWVVLFIALLIFAINNWRPVELKVWEGLVLETKIPALVFVALLLGLVPMWMLHRGRVWRLNRRINILESAARSAATSLAQVDAEERIAVEENAAIAEPETPAPTPKPTSEHS